MTTKMVEVISTLRALDVGPTILKMVRADLKKAKAPEIDADVQERLREECSDNGRALLVLGKDGKSYSVFSPEGHAALRASARKHQPWKHSHQKKTTAKH